MHWALLLHTSTSVPPLPSGLPPIHHTEPNHLRTRGRVISTLSPPIPIFTTLICAFDTQSILLIPDNPLRLCICTALFLDFSFHIIVSLPYRRTGTSNVSCKTLVHLSYNVLALTRDLIAFATLHPFTTTLRHGHIGTWFIQNTYQVFKFWHMLQLHPIH